MAVTTSMPGAATAVREAAGGRGFIAGRGYDLVLFILAPVLALALTEISALVPWLRTPTSIAGTKTPPVMYFVTVWTFAHLFAVVFRSHGNPQIFAQYRFRFVGVPILLFAGLMSSNWVLAIGAVLTVFWDVYHSSMQTFGLGRIYDARWGNDPTVGRRLDYWLNHVIYIGPILAGASLMPTLQTLNHFRLVQWQAPLRFRREIRDASDTITEVVIVAGVLFVAYYLYRYWQLYKQGYRPSPQKIALLVSTATVSITAWGFLVPWKAFVAVNFFHALQYFGIVWCMEKKSIRRLFRLTNVRSGHVLAFLAFALTVGVVGLAHQLYGDYYAIRWAGSLFIVVSLMHFWYDGFVWSVQKKQV